MSTSARASYLWKLNIAAAAVQAVQGTALAALVAADGRQKWPVQGLAWESEVTFTSNYELGWLVPAFSIGSSFNHLVVAAGGPEFTQKLLDKKQNWLRWTEYSVTAGLMLWIIGTLSGITDYRSLVSLVITNAALQAVGYEIELLMSEENPNMKAVDLLQTIGFILHLAIWVPIIISFFAVVDDSEDVPDAVYAIVWGLFLFFTSFGILSTLYTTKKIDYYKYEIGFIALSFFSKTFLAWFVYGGVLAADARFETATPTPTSSQ